MLNRKCVKSHVQNATYTEILCKYEAANQV